ncbi:unnamed protein product [Absidia cylindrospora]
MTKSKIQYTNNVRLEPTDFDLDQLDKYRFWAVCPGLNQVLVAVDGSDDDKAHEIREFSEVWEEKLTLSDFRTRDGTSTLQQVVSSYPTLKTASFERYALAVQARMASRSEVWPAQRKIRDQFYAMQDMGERFVNMFIGDGTGDETSSSSSSKAAVSHGMEEDLFSPIKLDPYSRGKVPVVCLGDIRFGDRDTRSLLKRCKDILRDAERDGQLVFLGVDEYHTSKRCSSCFKLTLSQVQADNGDFITGVQKCCSCGKMWRRDVNAARNLRSIVMHQILNKTLTRPRNLERPLRKKSDHQ